MRKGSFFVISAPSGAGKTTLCNKLCAALPMIRHSVSYTTRPPRPDETNDVHYTFVEKDTFQAMIAEGVFVEWAEVHGNYYGTSRKRIEELANAGIDVILDIDVQGASQIKKNLLDCIFIFILPPSMEALRKRLVERMTDPEEAIGIRLKNAILEIREYKKYDYVIVNDIMEEAFKELVSIVAAARIRTTRIDQEWINKNFFEEEA
ncbi:MAG: guanylate kinase [Dissulfurispiraceae bacterium]|jgi:guanylate kinase